jgi:hypothetical protein
MATILQLIERIKKADTDNIIEETMEEAAPLITDRQKDQMLGGINSEGKKIGRYRSPAYAAMKSRMNPIPGFGIPDLRLTGDFYKGIYTEVRGDKIITDSVDEKTQDLADKYGEEIFGLSKPVKKEAIKDIKPLFFKRIRNAIGL